MIGSIALASVLVGSVFIFRSNTKELVLKEELKNNPNTKIAMFVKNESGNYTKTNTIPEGNYTLSSESTCNNNATPRWENKELIISNLTSSNTNCFLYFDKVPSVSAIDRATQLVGALNISTARSGAITTSTEMVNTKLYSVADDYGTSYVYAGTNPNNWVRFAGFYWRIIRINGDGTIRLIYNGTNATATGTGTQISGTKAFNSITTDNAYVGFMYGATGQSGENAYTNTHINTNNSTILGASDGSESGTLNWWYKNNIANKTATVTSKIDTSGVFCNDREVKTGIHSSYTGNGTGTKLTSYAPWGRLYSGTKWKTSQTPSLKCIQANDIFSASSATRGNKKLTYPVGLITSDEVVLAGGLGGPERTFWLNTGQNYWTLSPRSFDGSTALVFLVYSGGTLNGHRVDKAYGVRPVINLRSDVKLTGSGTTTSPFTVEGAE